MIRNPLILALAAAASLAAQSVTLQGKVLSVSGVPIAGAVCKLKTLGLEAVTDAEGRYSFSGSAVAPRLQGYAMAVAAQGGRLSLRLDRRERVVLELHALTGARIAAIVDAVLPAGEHGFDLPAASGQQLYLLRASVGPQTSWHKLSRQGGLAVIASAGLSVGPAAKVAAADSLYCTHEGYHGGLARINGRKLSNTTGTQDIRMFSSDTAWNVCSPPITFAFDNSPGVTRYKQLIPDWVATEQAVLKEVCQSTFKLPSQAKKYKDYLADIKLDDGVAATGGNHLFFNTGYIAGQPNNYSGWWEVVGVQQHEAVHSYQPYYDTPGAQGFGEAMPDAVRALNGFFSWPKGTKCTGNFTDYYQDGGKYWYFIEMKHPGFLTTVWQQKTGDISARVQSITGESLASLAAECKSKGMP